jgi:hypothetical protein
VLDRFRSELRQQVFRHLARGDELRSGSRTSQQRAPAQFDGGEYLRGLGLPHSFELSQFIGVSARQPVEPSHRLQHGIGKGQCVAASRSASKDDCEQLVVAESRRAEALQLLARPVVRRDRFHGQGILT